MIFWIWFLSPLLSSVHPHGWVFREQSRTQTPPTHINPKQRPVLFNPLDTLQVICTNWNIPRICCLAGAEDQQEPREGRIISSKPTPCPGDASYCEDAEDYPSFIADLQIDPNKFVKDRIFGEPVPDVRPTLRFNSQEFRACAHRKEVIYPKKARNTSGTFVFIVNNLEYKQSVTIELCVSPDSQCKTQAQKDAPDGDTVCRQKYSTHKLYAINSEGQQVYDTFALPSACLCHHTQDFRLRSRIFSPAKEPELQCVPPAPLDVPDDKIHFPEMNQPEIPTPYCENQTFCENEQSYPNATILWELSQNQDLSNTLFLQLFDSQCQKNDTDIAVRVFTIDEEQLCIGSTKVVFPKVAKNLKEEWRYVVNIENYTQSVEVQECHNNTHFRELPIQGNQDKDYGSCMYSGSDGDHPELTSCRQLYSEHKLLSLTTEGQLEVDSFMLPSACACFVSSYINVLGIKQANVSDILSNFSLDERGEDE